MSFLSLANLRQRVIRRLRQVQGANTQLYSESIIDDMLQEAYSMCRSSRWWDHLMTWQTRQLDGTTGKCTVPFAGARERFRDVRMVLVGNNSVPLPIVAQGTNPFRLTGTVPRFIEGLSITDDPNGTYLFRVWPLTSTTTVDKPIRVWLRADPANLFTDPNVVVPFDSVALINQAAALYAADDGANAAQVDTLTQVFNQRMEQLQRQHDSAPIMLDPRMDASLSQWTEYP